MQAVYQQSQDSKTGFATLPVGADFLDDLSKAHEGKLDAATLTQHALECSVLNDSAHEHSDSGELSSKMPLPDSNQVCL